MVKKIFYAFLLSYFVLINIGQAHDFIPLNEEEYKSSILSLRCTTKQIIEGKLAQQIPGVDPLLGLTNIVELGEETKEIQFDFIPYGLFPVIEIPVGFPTDAHSLIMSIFTKQQWVPTDDLPFGTIFGKLTAPSGQQVGSFNSVMQDQPKELLAKFYQACNNSQQDNLTAVCQKNPELMQIAKRIINPTSDLSMINLTNLKNVAEILCYSLGGKVTSNPTLGVSFTVDMSKKLFIPSRGKMNMKKHKRLINSLMRNYFSEIGVAFDASTNSFVIVKS